MRFSKPLRDVRFNVVSVLFILLAAFMFDAAAQHVPGDVNGSGAVDAVDVQLSINAALGISIAPYDADVNNDGAVNAIDVQLVINAALGFSISWEVNVPNVVGMAQAAAETALTDVDLVVGVVTEQYSDSVPDGYVISQNPAAGAQILSSSPVALVVSLGQEPGTVPNLVGLTQAAAETAITTAGFVLGTVSDAFSATVAEGLVISQNPAAGASATAGSAVSFVVSIGPEPGTVPSIVGLTQSAATTALTNEGFVAGTVTQAYSASVTAGLVISQDPVAGTRIPAGSAVSFVVSLGAEPGTVPNVVGMTQAAASTAITGEGLVVGTVTQAYSETVPSGRVISQNPVAGTIVSLGSAVALVVSQGREPGTVPNVVGLPQASAQTIIVASRLTVGAVTNAYSETVPSGSVISQNPTAGTVVPAGSAVSMVVSLGPEPGTVPNIVGMTRSSAESAITAAGLTVGTVTEAYSDTVAVGRVISQDPTAGSLVASGSAVAFVVSLGPEPVTVPDVVGMSQSAAESAITTAGLTVGDVTTGSSDTVPAGDVISQDPAAGTQQLPGTAIDLLVSSGPDNQETVELPGGISLLLMWIPDGSFQMGRYSGEQSSSVTEDPQHTVTFADGFWMSACEITKEQWTAVMGTTPWDGELYVLDEADSPAVYVSWTDAQAFVAALNTLTGETYRLPSEAEWEYACRAGTSTRFYWGDDPTYTDIDDYAWWDGNAYGAGRYYAHIVGLKLPNVWGLYDMSGNVMEWCQDWWHDDYTGAPTDGSAWLSGGDTYRIARGGHWHVAASSCRSASRTAGNPTDKLSRIGFRVCK